MEPNIQSVSLWLWWYIYLDLVNYKKQEVLDEFIINSRPSNRLPWVICSWNILENKTNWFLFLKVFRNLSAISGLELNCFSYIEFSFSFFKSPSTLCCLMDVILFLQIFAIPTINDSLIIVIHNWCRESTENYKSMV